MPSQLMVEVGRTGSLIKIGVSTQDLSIMQTLYLESGEAEKLKDELTACLQEVDLYERLFEKEAEKFMKLSER